MENADKRSVATDALETLGSIIGTEEKRDAIHLAVEPVTAGERLFPGQDVGLVEGKAARCANPLGIVDPFLRLPVEAGERFWLVVYPRQIRSLRHVWEHPGFPSSDVVTDAKAASEAWLRAYVKSNDLPKYDIVIAAALSWHSWDGQDYVLIDGSAAHADIPPEFWDHLQIVTGHQPPDVDYRPKFFSCSC